MVGDQPKATKEQQSDYKLTLIEFRDRTLEEEGRIVLDDRFFIPAACPSSISMNVLAALPQFALEKFGKALTKLGKKELDLRRYIKTHPEFVPDYITDAWEHEVGC